MTRKPIWHIVVNGEYAFDDCKRTTGWGAIRAAKRALATEGREWYSLGADRCTGDCQTPALCGCGLPRMDGTYQCADCARFEATRAE